MAPKEWRDSEGLKLEDVAALLKRSRMSVWNYETGRRDAPNSVVRLYAKISKGKVTSDDLHAVRRKFLDGTFLKAS
jgi:transcriptional regulator with XRE-family HTH domain